MYFREWLITEAKDYFVEKISTVLIATQQLVQNFSQTSGRQQVDFSVSIVNQIRKILHTSWSKAYMKYLLKLQKCGVALMKCIDEKGSLHETLESVESEIEEITTKLGKPVWGGK